MNISKKRLFFFGILWLLLSVWLILEILVLDILPQYSGLYGFLSGSFFLLIIYLAVHLGYQIHIDEINRILGPVKHPFAQSHSYRALPLNPELTATPAELQIYLDNLRKETEKSNVD